MCSDTDDLYRGPELVQFYDIENAWAEDCAFLMRFSAGARSVLDLGCGTGLVAATIAAEHGCECVGVDPAIAMLAVARERSGGERVHWIEGDARTIRLRRLFDRVLMTGHAFQVFLNDADRAAVLATIAAHLAPGGRFVLDSRNPAAEAWRRWTPAASERRIVHPTLGAVRAWNDAAHDPASGVVSYETIYEVLATGKRYSTRSKIAFPSHEALAALIEGAGLAVEAWMGDWGGRPFEAAAPEIIPVGRLKDR